jgi:hypothetical protein
LSPDQLGFDQVLLVGKLRLDGRNLTGRIEYREEDFHPERTNGTYAVVYAHTNFYTCTFHKVEELDATNRVATPSH